MRINIVTFIILILVLSGCSVHNEKKQDGESQTKNRTQVSGNELIKNAKKDLIGEWISTKPIVSFKFRDDGKFIEQENYLESKVGTYEIVKVSKNEIKVEQIFNNKMRTYFIKLNPDKQSFELKFSNNSKYSLKFKKAESEDEFEKILDQKGENDIKETNSIITNNSSEVKNEEDKSIETDDDNTLNNATNNDINPNNNTNDINSNETNSNNNTDDINSNKTNENADNSIDANSTEPINEDSNISERYKYMTPNEREKFIELEKEIINNSNAYIEALDNSDNEYEYQTISPGEEGYATDNPNAQP
ncbi:hypothetical protein [Macrococcoides canis]|uniref:hypothetical protein n=1 Tax=Macrococcoides canis TaxID=1855823 RepID=UPI00165E8B03|nr:hypothetical protein [Macrococcus canis]QNR07712.1 hypothetical protein GL258_05400 [Macrococcus canis]